jgi:hypothetical protein
MKKIYVKNIFAALCLSSSFTLFSQQNVSINLSGALSPNPAILDLSDVSNAHLGFLMTNVNLTSITDIVTIAAPTVGMIVWNTDAALPNGVGYYYWSGTQWCYLYNTGSALGGITGTGTINYLARWTPTATTLGIGVCQDNGTTVGINIVPVATQMLTVAEATAADIAILGDNTAGSGTNNGIGVEGISSQAYAAAGPVNGYGVVAFNKNTTGTGLYAAGNNLPINDNFLLVGSGASIIGTDVGVFGWSTSSTSNAVYGQASGANSTGVVGGGNNYGPNLLAAGSGGAFGGESYGIFAETENLLNPSAAGVFLNDETGNEVYVAYYNGTNYKIYGTSPGTVSCSVQDTKGNYVVMHAPETPEDYYEDYGQGQLMNGKVHIDMDPNYAKNICVNDKHPLRVFVQLYGDCKGVYVTHTTATGFDVVELDGGTSNTPFQYQIIGNAADAVMPSGVVSKFADLRFEPASKVLPTRKAYLGLQKLRNQ